MSLEELRDDIILKQKKGLPFILTSVIIWSLILLVHLFNLPIFWTNILVFSCSAPLLPISWFIGKRIGVNIFDESNPLGEFGFLFTLNQILYLLIVMWVFNAVPDKMVMVYAMVFGAHLLPYSWLYKSFAYKFFAVMIPIMSLIIGNIFSPWVLTLAMVMVEVVFSYCLYKEVK